MGIIQNSGTPRGPFFENLERWSVDLHFIYLGFSQSVVIWDGRIFWITATILGPLTVGYVNANPWLHPLTTYIWR